MTRSPRRSLKHPPAVVERITEAEITAIYSALDSMPPECREAFRWSKIEGMSHAEAARRLKMKGYVFRRHLARALVCIYFAVEAAGGRQ
jgi:RNA polymerase sigma-70 factor (ECF subfamily)